MGVERGWEEKRDTRGLTTWLLYFQEHFVLQRKLLSGLRRRLPKFYPQHVSQFPRKEISQFMNMSLCPSYRKLVSQFQSLELQKVQLRHEKLQRILPPMILLSKPRSWQAAEERAPSREASKGEFNLFTIQMRWRQLPRV